MLVIGVIPGRLAADVVCDGGCVHFSTWLLGHINCATRSLSQSQPGKALKTTGIVK